MTEYQLLKKLLYAAKDVSSDFTGTEANSMIYDSCAEAYEDLEECEKAHVEAGVKALNGHIHGRGHKLGRRAALEVLASIAFHLEKNGGGE